MMVAASRPWATCGVANRKHFRSLPVRSGDGVSLCEPVSRRGYVRWSCPVPALGFGLASHPKARRPGARELLGGKMETQIALARTTCPKTVARALFPNSPIPKFPNELSYENSSKKSCSPRGSAGCAGTQLIGHSTGPSRFVGHDRPVDHRTLLAHGDVAAQWQGAGRGGLQQHQRVSGQRRAV